MCVGCSEFPESLYIGVIDAIKNVAESKKSLPLQDVLIKFTNK